MLSFVISTVFLLAPCPSPFEGGWTWPHVWAAPRRKTFAPASVCAGFPEEKKKKKKPIRICGVICQDEIKSSGRAEAVVPVETDYSGFIAHVGSVGHRGETCKWEWKRGRRLVWITPILFQQNIIWRLLLPVLGLGGVASWGPLAVGRSVKVTDKRIPIKTFTLTQRIFYSETNI